MAQARIINCAPEPTPAAMRGGETVSERRPFSVIGQNARSSLKLMMGIHKVLSGLLQMESGKP